MLKILNLRIVITLIVINLQSIQAFGQKEEVVFFSKAKAAWLEQNDSLAVFLFKRLIKEYPTNKPLMVISYYYLGDIALAKKNYQESEFYLKEITNLPLNNKHQQLFLKYTGHFSYTDFLHNTFTTLGNISLKVGKFKEALFYFEESKLKYLHTDSETPLFKLTDIESRVECYMNLQLPDNALLLVLDFYLESNQYADAAIHTLGKKCIEKSYTAEIASELEKGIERIHFVQKDRQNKNLQAEVSTYIYNHKVLFGKYYSDKPFEEEFQQMKLELAKGKLRYFMNQLLDK